MKDIQRISPVVLKSTPLKTEKRDNWEVVMEYKGEGDGPFLVDVSHKPRFDLQDADVSSFTPFGMNLPKVPGNCLLENGILANRMNRTQVSLFNLAGSGDVSMPDETAYTDVTESTVCIALIGKQVFSICEKLTALDFMDPQKKAPFLFQGPFSHVPCQIVTLNKEGDSSGLVMTCSRGYSRDIIHAILDAGEEYGLKPAGETRFTNWINSL
ncbi:MAG: sarcosine oxidase subunit gamma SoxG [Proteobacteria bacterium]|nr:sarcosine oxidase subunit gamma SoxG [Pseudomonadota bacterium]MBU1581506.1 sarcosine oxidase subunit gamma SoxG [Pseudomonadota bacterium]MBU2455998.1 sarcosine oxidase subunit gamma SoxG [Pseudomonadota bacterium]MBU2628082.1 sarcosine oxidase subunit gamma SoxG [Pseudomonadota bacterium]